LHSITTVTMHVSHASDPVGVLRPGRPILATHLLVLLLVFALATPGTYATVDLTPMIDSKMAAVNSLVAIPGTLMQSKTDLVSGMAGSLGNIGSGLGDMVSSLMSGPQQLIQAKMDLISGFSMSETRDLSAMQAETLDIPSEELVQGKPKNNKSASKQSTLPKSDGKKRASEETKNSKIDDAGDVAVSEPRKPHGNLLNRPTKMKSANNRQDVKNFKNAKSSDDVVDTSKKSKNAKSADKVVDIPKTVKTNKQIQQKNSQKQSQKKSQPKIKRGADRKSQFVLGRRMLRTV